MFCVRISIRGLNFVRFVGNDIRSGARVMKFDGGGNVFFPRFNMCIFSRIFVYSSNLNSFHVKRWREIILRF